MSVQPDTDLKPASGKPDRTDIHIGKRLREGRLNRRLSQTALADYVKLSFQQIQKYESGANRISASTLWEFSAVLGVSLEWFFAGLDVSDEEQPHSPAPPISRRSGQPLSLEFDPQLGVKVAGLARDEQDVVLSVIRCLRRRPTKGHED